MNHTTSPFHNLNVVVFGGTSGIGQACVERLINQGANLAVLGKPEPSETEQPSHSASAKCLVFRTELVDAASVEIVYRDILHGLNDRIDAVIYTLGGSARSYGDGSLLECTEEGWSAALRLNLDLAFWVLKKSVDIIGRNPLDRFGQKGSIALVGSVLADHPSASHFSTAGYATAKAGLEGLVKNAAATYASHAIRINMLKPGLVSTPMAARAIDNPDIAEYLRKKQPLTKGPISAAACANALLGLIDPQSTGLTGCIQTLDAGWSLSDG